LEGKEREDRKIILRDRGKAELDLENSRGKKDISFIEEEKKEKEGDTAPLKGKERKRKLEDLFCQRGKEGVARPSYAEKGRYSLTTSFKRKNPGGGVPFLEEKGKGEGERK